MVEVETRTEVRLPLRRRRIWDESDDTVHRHGAKNQAGNEHGNHTEIYSGGGDIIVRGSRNLMQVADDRDESGIYQWGQMTMKSGRGSITMQVPVERTRGSDLRSVE